MFNEDSLKIWYWVHGYFQGKTNNSNFFDGNAGNLYDEVWKWMSFISSAETNNDYSKRFLAGSVYPKYACSKMVCFLFLTKKMLVKTRIFRMK